ncbi:MAG: NAD(P)-dependent alcohol dehydrogenase [Myxococcota bacterium]
MRAITQTTYGGPDRLSLAEVARPTPGPRDVLIEVHASAVTQGDRRLRAGDFPGITWLPGRLAIGLTGPRQPVCGTMFAGRVVERGAEVTRFSVGDAVFGSPGVGAWATHVAMPEDGSLAAMPAGLTFEEAASLPYGGVTALVFLGDLGQLAPGEHVCILGASGGVGRFAVQVARHMGAEVTAVSSRETHALVRSLGADHVVDYRTQDFTQTARPYDLVLDTVGTTSFRACRRALSPTGRYLSLLVTARLLIDMLVTRLRGGQRAITGVAMDRPQELDELRALAEAGVIRPVIDGVFPLEEIAKAHAHLESSATHGTVVVRVSDRSREVGTVTAATAAQAGRAGARGAGRRG